MQQRCSCLCLHSYDPIAAAHQITLKARRARRRAIRPASQLELPESHGQRDSKSNSNRTEQNRTECADSSFKQFSRALDFPYKTTTTHTLKKAPSKTARSTRVVIQEVSTKHQRVSVSLCLSLSSPPWVLPPISMRFHRRNISYWFRSFFLVCHNGLSLVVRNPP